MTKCFLCYSDKAEVKETTSIYRIECPFCGDYKIDVFIDDFFSSISADLRLKLRHAVKKYKLEQQELSSKKSLLLDENKIAEIDKSISVPNLLDKIELVMDYIENKTSFLFEKLEVDTNTLFPLFFGKNNYELWQIIEYLKSIRYIKTDAYFYKLPDNQYCLASCFNNKISIKSNESSQYESNYCVNKNDSGFFVIHQPCYNVALTPEGLNHQAHKQYNHLNSKQCFVAMWFNEKEDKENHRPDMNKIYEDAIKPAIEVNDRQFKALKINDKEHCNDINDEMIAQIRRSRFMVVDLTGYRGGVYWEAGFAYGLGMPVIYTCHEKWLETNRDGDGSVIREGVHFDLNHRNIICWNEENLDDFKEKLINRIEAIII